MIAAWLVIIKEYVGFFFSEWDTNSEPLQDERALYCTLLLIDAPLPSTRKFVYISENIRVFRGLVNGLKGTTPKG